MRTAEDMAREAGLDEWWDSGSEWRETFNEHLKTFAALVRADERELCAKRLEAVGCDHCAANIRLRGQA